MKSLIIAGVAVGSLAGLSLPAWITYDNVEVRTFIRTSTDPDRLIVAAKHLPSLASVTYMADIQYVGKIAMPYNIREPGWCERALIWAKNHAGQTRQQLIKSACSYSISTLVWDLYTYDVVGTLPIGTPCHIPAWEGEWFKARATNGNLGMVQCANLGR